MKTLQGSQVWFGRDNLVNTESPINRRTRNFARVFIMMYVVWAFSSNSVLEEVRRLLSQACETLLTKFRERAATSPFGAWEKDSKAVGATLRGLVTL